VEFRSVVLRNNSNEQFDQLSALDKCEVVQSRLGAPAKRLDALSQTGNINVLLGLGIELAQLLRQTVVGLRDLLSSALELFTLDYLRQI
jgi:hypothetical protein